MANPKHLAILKKGVDAWNKWRRKYPNRRPDLREVNLNEANLNEANLAGANLGNANLTGAYLREASLDEANLAGAQLDGADLRDANLIGAQLYRASLFESHLLRAQLKGADLREANLSRAELNAADLRGTKLNKAELFKAELFKADLSAADLSTADLLSAYLVRAKLRGAQLRSVHLYSADLRATDLEGADLHWADLRETNLAGANLAGANLIKADLSAANLFGADLSATSMGGTILTRVTLEGVKGLETVQHHSASSIGIDTIYFSKGQISESFLRGAGVPENFITFMHSLTGKAFEYYSCFISYSDRDKSFAECLYADLQAKGVRCWFAPEDLKIGDKFAIEIDEAIRLYDKLLLVLSERSIESAWVEHEVRSALKKEQEQNRTVLFPIRLDNAVLETTQQWAHDIKRNRHIGDFSQWKDHDCYQKSFVRLLRDLQASDAKPNPS